MLSPTPLYSMSHFQWQTLLLCEPRTQYQHLEPQGEWMWLSQGKQAWLTSSQCYVVCIPPGTQRWSLHLWEQSRSPSELVSPNVQPWTLPHQPLGMGLYNIQKKYGNHTTDTYNGTTACTKCTCQKKSVVLLGQLRKHSSYNSFNGTCHCMSSQ